MNSRLFFTANEDYNSFHYCVPMNDYNFYKTLTINNDKNYDYYEEAFYFSKYYFMVAKKIPKITNEITFELVQNFKCDISDESFQRLWRFGGKSSVMFWELVDPADYMKKYSMQLYEKYLDCYNKSRKCLIN